MLLVAIAMMAVLSDTPAEDQGAHHTGGRTLLEMQILDGRPRAVELISQKHQWPGTYFETRFSGRELIVNLIDTDNRYRLFVDDLAPVILDRPGNTPYTVKGLSQGLHTARLEKLSESQSGTGSFYGFVATDGKVASFLPRALQIEFIGDSYTVGYGNTSGKHECTPEELRVSTDTQMAYGPRTAKSFDADYQINAVSGRGIVRNYDGYAGDTLPELYSYTLFDKQTPYTDDEWKPQVIVIGLGGNDFSTPLKPGEKWADDAALKADFEATYVTFVKGLRAQNPHAWILLTKYQGPIVADEVERVAAALKADGDARIDTIGMDDFTKSGCDGHLDVEDDKRIAQQLIANLGGLPDLPKIETEVVPLIVDPGTGPIEGPQAEDLPAFPHAEPAIGEPLNPTKLQRNKTAAGHK